MSADADLLIIGGGCAGLSLAMRLTERGPRTIVLEAREKYVDDRTWCFWDDGSAPLHSLVSHSWPAVTVRAGPIASRLDCASTPYRMLPSRAFYNAATRRIAATERITLEQPSHVLAEPEKTGDVWRVETHLGPRTARMVVDTRPIAPARGGAVLWQSFAGREIECVDEKFDPATAELMDFAPPGPDRVAFTYVLPVSRTRALIEFTVFGPDPLDRATLAADLEAAVARRTDGAGCTTLREESGILPMGIAQQPASADPTFLRAGLTAGGARPSTGYAFQRIQRWADSCAQALLDGSPPSPHPPDPPLVRVMDRILLAVIRTDPADAPRLFATLFARADTARIIRFLSDRATLADYAAIVWALPKAPFIRRLPHAVSNRRLLAA